MTVQSPTGAPVIKVIDGPFAGFEGVVNGIDQSKGSVQVLLSFFGREITVVLDVRKVRRMVV